MAARFACDDQAHVPLSQSGHPGEYSQAPAAAKRRRFFQLQSRLLAARQPSMSGPDMPTPCKTDCLVNLICGASVSPT